MNSNTPIDITRPYLVIPKLVAQPTWGGQYIVTMKGWQDRLGHDIKIGQAYELFSGSNLSLLTKSDDTAFGGELTDNHAVQIQTHPDNSVALQDLLAVSPEAVLGQEVVTERGPNLELLIKYTQALGNSFQVHIKDGIKHDTWKPKPESWYYFEPGILTLGIKQGASWDDYRQAVTEVDMRIRVLGTKVSVGEMTYEAAQLQVKELLQTYNPWQYVNVVTVDKDALVDLSSGGLHHSWEEDEQQAPLGNVLYELQAEAMDEISTFRSFDKGKLAADGSVRDVHIDEYFEVIDRSPEANDPAKHLQQPQLVSETDAYRHEHLMASTHYVLDKLTLRHQSATYTEQLTRYKHLFVKSGKVQVVGGGVTLTITTAHSCFIPAAVGSYTITNLEDESEILVSY